MKKNASIKLFFLLSLILINASSQNFLQFDTKTKCPKVPLTSLGILISLADYEESSYKSDLSQKDKEKYENIVALKRSFASTMSYIPKSFKPESEEYWGGINYLLVVFVIIAVFPIIFILFYMFMRFVLKKCTGPKKISEVNKIYRNITWFIMITCSVANAILFAIVLAKSVSVGKNIEKTFNYAASIIAKSDDAYPSINKLVENFRSEGLSVPDAVYMKNFKEKTEVYIKNTKERTQQILSDDSKRTKITAFVFAAYYFLVLLAYIFFFLKIEIGECIVSIFLFFAVPSILILEGYNAKFFFYYGDLCDSVHGALYDNEFPVADQALGYYYNCFPLEIKAIIYNVRYRLYEQSENNKDYRDKFNELENGTFQKIFRCELVSSVIPRIEKDFCKDSLDSMYTLVELMTWIVLIAFGVALGSRRLQVLIWKRKNEIASMIQNQEVLY